MRDNDTIKSSRVTLIQEDCEQFNLYHKRQAFMYEEN